MNTRSYALPFVGFAQAQRGLPLIGLFGLWRQRQALARMDDHMLQDLGLTRDEAQAESARPVWDVPAHWRG